MTGSTQRIPKLGMDEVEIGIEQKSLTNNANKKSWQDSAITHKSM